MRFDYREVYANRFTTGWAESAAKWTMCSLVITLTEEQRALAATKLSPAAITVRLKRYVLEQELSNTG